MLLLWIIFLITMFILKKLYLTYMNKSKIISHSLVSLSHNNNNINLYIYFDLICYNSFFNKWTSESILNSQKEYYYFDIISVISIKISKNNKVIAKIKETKYSIRLFFHCYENYNFRL